MRNLTYCPFSFVGPICINKTATFGRKNQKIWCYFSVLRNEVLLDVVFMKQTRNSTSTLLFFRDGVLITVYFQNPWPLLAGKIGQKLRHFWREKFKKFDNLFGREKNWKTQLGLLILVSLGSLGLFFMRWDGVHSSSCKMESSLVRWRPLWLGSAILTPYSWVGNTFGLWHWTDCNIYWRALFYAASHFAS